MHVNGRSHQFSVTSCEHACDLKISIPIEFSLKGYPCLATLWIDMCLSIQIYMCPPFCLPNKTHGTPHGTKSSFGMLQIKLENTNVMSNSQLTHGTME